MNAFCLRLRPTPIATTEPTKLIVCGVGISTLWQCPDDKLQASTPKFSLNNSPFSRWHLRAEGWSRNGCRIECLKNSLFPLAFSFVPAYPAQPFHFCRIAVFGVPLRTPASVSNEPRPFNCRTASVQIAAT